MKPSRLTLPPPSRWLLLGALLLLGPACTRRVETRASETRCCTSLHGCMELMVASTGPIQEEEERSLPLERLDPLKQCAARELVKWGAEAHSGLVRLLTHPAPQVRSGAALALSKMGMSLPEQTPDAFPALLHAHERGPTELLLLALLRSDDARAAPALRRYLQEGPFQPSLPCIGPTLATAVVEALEATDVTPPVVERAVDLLCSSTQKLIPRVQAILRRELARPALWRPSAPSCQEPVPRTCQFVDDGCTPYAGILAQAISGQARSELYPEFMEALARDDGRLTPRLLHYLSHTDSPEFDAWRARLLESPVPDCRQHALGRIDLPPPQARQALQSLLERGAPWEREQAALVLARFGDDLAVSALLRALDDPHAAVQAAAALALGRLKQKASAALPRLEELAGTHASPYVRLNAAIARFEMTGQWKPPKAYPCLALKKLDGEPGQWELRLSTGPIRLREFQRPPGAPHTSGPCAGVRDDASHHPGFVPMSQACLVLSPRVEGVRAETWVSEKGRHISLEHWGRAANPLYTLEFHGKRLVVHGMWHMSIFEGDVGEVSQTPQGGWMMTPFASLPGAPGAQGIDSRGDLLVRTSDGYLLDSDLGETGPHMYSEAFGATCYPVVRITPDGQVFDVE